RDHGAVTIEVWPGTAVNRAAVVERADCVGAVATLAGRRNRVPVRSSCAVPDGDGPECSTVQEVHGDDDVADRPAAGEVASVVGIDAVCGAESAAVSADQCDLGLEELDIDVAITARVQPLKARVADQVTGWIQGRVRLHAT